MKTRVCEFDVQDLLPIGLLFVVTGIGIAYGISVMGSIKTDYSTTGYKPTQAGGCNSTHQSGCGYAFNASRDAITATGVFSSKFSLIATVIVAAIIIGILVKYLMVRNQ
jgi:hypothetical protein